MRSRTSCSRAIRVRVSGSVGAGRGGIAPGVVAGTALGMVALGTALLAMLRLVSMLPVGVGRGCGVI